MPSPQRLVINTSPLLACIAGCGSLAPLQGLYGELLVPSEVAKEIAVGGAHGFGVAEFNAATWLRRWPAAVEAMPLLRNALDAGEAAVIQLALDEGIATVCIDEPVGRRLARLCGLQVTGSVGMLIRARREGRISSMRQTLERMKTHGIWLSEAVLAFALRETGEG
jgi:predicted nucleic acid-binding protein